MEERNFYSSLKFPASLNLLQPAGRVSHLQKKKEGAFSSLSSRLTGAGARLVILTKSTDQFC